MGLINQVGSYFISQYYRVLQETPEFTHQFYNDLSTLTRDDGNDSQTVSNIMVMIFFISYYHLLFFNLLSICMVFLDYYEFF